MAINEQMSTGQANVAPLCVGLLLVLLLCYGVLLLFFNECIDYYHIRWTYELLCYLPLCEWYISKRWWP